MQYIMGTLALVIQNTDSDGYVFMQEFTQLS